MYKKPVSTGKRPYGGVSMRSGSTSAGVRDRSAQESFDTSLLVGPVYENSAARKKTAIKQELSDITKRLHQVSGNECFKFKYHKLVMYVYWTTSSFFILYTDTYCVSIRFLILYNSVDLIHNLQGERTQWTAPLPPIKKTQKFK